MENLDAIEVKYFQLQRPRIGQLKSVQAEMQASPAQVDAKHFNYSPTARSTTSRMKHFMLLPWICNEDDAQQAAVSWVQRELAGRAENSITSPKSFHNQEEHHDSVRRSKLKEL
jgi:hypothetical protein